jgi:uncharacterized damage-inducible protein DinB
MFAASRTPRAQSAAVAGFKTEYFANLDEAEEKLLQLAEAMPAEKYSWRPMPGVRSVGEVYMHAAGANYFLSTFLGTEAPKMSGDIEKTVTKKADVIAEMRRSFDHLRRAVNATRDLDKKVKMFGKTTTHRGVLLTTLSHVHEQLGLSIGYARMNGVVPPWSR